jgi:hypothetical protein
MFRAILPRVQKVHLLHYPSGATKTLTSRQKSAPKLMQKSKGESIEGA